MKKGDFTDRVMDASKHETLPDVDQHILRYVEKLTISPVSVSAEDVQALRDAGLKDRTILDICQITAYFALVNRLAEGLGVALEPSYEQ